MQKLLHSLRPGLAGHGIHGTGAGDEGTIGHGSDAGEADFGHVAGLAGEGEVFAQWEVRVTFPHEDAAEVRVTGEFDAHHVPDFTLMPIGRGPDVTDGGGLFFIRDLSLDAEVLVMAVTIHFINHFKTRLLAHVIQAGDVHEVVEVQFVTAVFEQRFHAAQGNLQGVLAPEFGGAKDGIAEFFLQGGDHLRGVHDAIRGGLLTF